MNEINKDVGAGACWFVGAHFGSEGDQTSRFIEEGIWENGHQDEYLEDVRSMQQGDRIAIKASYTRKHDMPFENHGQRVSVMAIKAIGTVRKNYGDGRRVDVDWTRLESHREWYFYTNMKTLWKVLPVTWEKKSLIDFAFNGKDQDRDSFLSVLPWREKYSEDRFGWTVFYEALADRLMDFRDKRDELVAGIHDIAKRVKGLSYLQEDKFPDGTVGPLKDICPFTTMGMFNRGLTPANRKNIASELARFLDLKEAVPDLTNGIPTLNNMGSWFFGYAKDRDDGDIDALWDVFAEAMKFSESEEVDRESAFSKAYDKASSIKYVGWTLTMGLYWMRPRSFPTLEDQSRRYIREGLGIQIGFNGPKKRCSADDYLTVMEDLKTRFLEDSYPIHSFPELSEAAWNYKGGKVGPVNPKLHDLSPNTIFYGPPGTGKTYHLKNKLFDIFTDKDSTQTEAEFCKELARDLTWWEIIAIVLIDLKEAKVQEIYEHPLLQAKNDISENNQPKNTIWHHLMSHTNADCPNVNLTKRHAPQIFWKSKDSVWSIGEEISREELPDYYEIFDRYKNFEPQTKSETRYVFTTFHQSFSYEDFIEGIKPRLVMNDEATESQDIQYHIANGIFKDIAKRAKDNPQKEYAIFIDEINRGNIANIFGELITLIEEDKRIGCDNYIPATLPYSKEVFGVPKNLYIIGTMNTADRSVEALDTALRRRFSFNELAPNPSLLSGHKYKCAKVDLEKLLSTINDRIERLLDKDYCIGHAYFMSIKDHDNPLDELKEIFRNRILPLMQEYFYGDWGKILLVLGEGFIKKEEGSVKFLNEEIYSNDAEIEAKPIYNFTDSEKWLENTFKGVYEKSE